MMWKYFFHSRPGGFGTRLLPTLIKSCFMISINSIHILITIISINIVINIIVALPWLQRTWGPPCPSLTSCLPAFFPSWAPSCCCCCYCCCCWCYFCCCLALASNYCCCCYSINDEQAALSTEKLKKKSNWEIRKVCLRIAVRERVLHVH